MKRDFVSELDKMTEEEYRALKAAEMTEAKTWMDEIVASKDPAVLYRDGRPVCDLKQLFESTVEIFGDKVLYHQIMKGDKEFSTISYREALKHIRGLGTAFIELGLKGEHIAVIGPNCYEWVETYHAVAGGTGVVVPLDKELGQEDLEKFCNEGDVTAVVCCSDKHYKLFKEIKSSKNTGIKYVIGINQDEHEDTKQGLYSWNLLRAEGMRIVEEGDRRFIDARIRNTDMAVIIYTSGTTGDAKGVMLSHRNLCADVMIAHAYLEVRPSDIFFSVLPIHHTYECTCSMLESFYMGASIAFCRGLKYITKDMQMVKPTFLLAVPLIYEKFYKSINKALVKEGKDKQLKMLFAINKVTSKLGINVAKSAIEKITAQFGGNIRMFIAGGAKVNPEVLAFFCNLGIKTLQGYGLTETAPMVALNPDEWHLMRNDSAGKVFQHTECKIVDPDENGNGEICFRGPQVMLGYYKNQAATDACIEEDGWFHTGDLGHVDKDGYVYITGRQKNVIIASNGKNVFPEELEEKLLRSQYIDECMVWSDENQKEAGKKGIFVTLKVDKENLKSLLGKDADNREKVMKVLEQEIDAINDTMPDWKNIKHIVIKSGDFVKTTGMKIKRFVKENREA